MPKVWRFLPFDAARVRSLSAELSVSPVLAQVLSARGYLTGPQSSAFLNAKLSELHDPEALPGVAEAADRIVSAIQASRRITIYENYDGRRNRDEPVMALPQARRGRMWTVRPAPHGRGLRPQLRRLAEIACRRSARPGRDGGLRDSEHCRSRSVPRTRAGTRHHRSSPVLGVCSRTPVAWSIPFAGTQYPFGDLCGVGSPSSSHGGSVNGWGMGSGPLRGCGSF